MVQFDVKRVQKGVQTFMVSFDFSKTPITQIADYVIIAGSKNKASDIHFDPRDGGLMIRFRMDGDLQDYTFVPKAYEKNLTTRLKLLANMNITESRLPQDGAIKGEYGGKYLDMRVSALPTNLGEKLVIRILDYTKSLDGIESLDFHPDNLEKIKRLMRLPNGIILTTGATGSGKSTTTYSILQELNKPEKNIITVEDPIEMNIEGINQVQVNSEIGMTFAAALRSILRQDPNIVLIGEIRDSETAQIAIRTSITGHLVLSTIHTNNALSTIERLLDMDVERYLLSTALSGIISQRLAKTLCPKCRIVRETTPFEKKIFKRHLRKDIDKIYDANPKGCDDCRKGYKGRLAFHEVLEIDDDIRDALNNEKLEKDDLRKMVYTNKTITMLQDALIKVLEGKTSFEEVFNAIEIEAKEGDNYQKDIPDDEDQEINYIENEKELEDDEETYDKEENNNVIPSLPLTNDEPIEEPQLPQQNQQVQTNLIANVQPPIGKTVIPEQQSVIPQQTVMPQQTVIPQQQTVIPQQQTVMPQQNVMSQQTVIPQQTIMPQQQVVQQNPINNQPLSQTVVKPVVQYPNQVTTSVSSVNTTTTNPNVINNIQ